MILKAFVRQIFQEITCLGGIVFYGLFSFYFLLNQKYNLFFMLLSGLMIVYLVTLVIKTFYFKHRPEKMKYNNFIEKIDASSFPSIHAARATFLFIFITENFNKGHIFLFLSFILTLLVLYSRIYLKKHDFIDIVGGVVLGGLSFFVISLVI